MPTSSGFQINEVLTADNTNTYLLRTGRNCIINGAMNIAQRNNGVTGISSGGTYHTVDRWIQTLNVCGTWSQQQNFLSASDAPCADGIRQSIKATCTTATGSLGAGAYNAILQAIEGYNLQQFAKGNASAKYFAVSFWVKSNAVGTYIAELYDLDNSRTVSASYTVASSGVWQKVRLIFPSDSIGGFDNDNAASLQVLFWLGAGSNYNSATLQTSWATMTANKRATGQTNVGVAVNNYFEITGVQLEPNSVCTPFEMEDIEVTRAKCWRYFQRHYTPSLRGVTSNSFNRMAMSYPPMRAIPSVTSNGGIIGFYNGTTAVIAGVGLTATYQFFSNTTVEMDISSAGWGTGSPAVFYQTNTSTFVLDLNSEL